MRSLPVTGAAVSVMTSGGHRGVVFATDETARALEDVQFTVGEGPGCDAFESGHAVLIPDLGATTTPGKAAWSAFREVARELEVHAVFSFPLHLGAASLGVLTVYHVEPGTLSGDDLARAVRLSDAAASALLEMIVGADGTGPPGGDRSDGGGAEFYRAEIYQTAGMIMVQLGVSIEVATVRLRSRAFATGRPVGDVARDIVRHKLRLDANNDSTPQ